MVGGEAKFVQLVSHREEDGISELYALDKDGQVWVLDRWTDGEPSTWRRIVSRREPVGEEVRKDGKK